MERERVVEYIKKAIEAGQSDDTTSRKLRSIGLSDAEISAAYEDARDVEAYGENWQSVISTAGNVEGGINPDSMQTRPETQKQTKEYGGKEIALGIRKEDFDKRPADKDDFLSKVDPSKVSKKEGRIFVWVVLAVFILLYVESRPTVTGYAYEPINLTSDPVQDMNITSVTMKSHDGKDTILTRAKYTIAGKVVGKSWYDVSFTYLLTKWAGIDIFKANNVPLDLCMTWGDMADEKYSKSLNYRMISIGLGGRACQVSYVQGDPHPGTEYMKTHLSNNHIIPANDNIYNAFTQVGVGDEIVIDGYLVDLGPIKTSLTRDDYGCEIIYVDKLRIGKDIYS